MVGFLSRGDGGAWMTYAKFSWGNQRGKEGAQGAEGHTATPKQTRLQTRPQTLGVLGPPTATGDHSSDAGVPLVGM